MLLIKSEIRPYQCDNSETLDRPVANIYDFGGIRVYAELYAAL
jgi:hypothetical protein